MIPDLHNYAGRGGRAIPLWQDDGYKVSNVRPSIISFLTERYKREVATEDLFAYIAAIAANPSYGPGSRPDLSTPGLRIPLTADQKLFTEAAQLGKSVLWLHTFGERMGDTTDGRPAGPPRMPLGSAPFIPEKGGISGKPDDMPDTLGYNVAKHRLLIGHGFIDNVSPAVWNYEVSGKQVLVQWFSRKGNRERPIIGDRRPPIYLGSIQPDHGLPEYTTELLNVLNVLGLLVELEPKQAELLEEICAGPLISEVDLKTAGALDAQGVVKHKELPMFPN